MLAFERLYSLPKDGTGSLVTAVSIYKNPFRAQKSLSELLLKLHFTDLPPDGLMNFFFTVAGSKGLEANLD